MTVLQTLTQDTQGEQNFSFNVSFAQKPKNKEAENETL